MTILVQLILAALSGGIIVKGTEVVANWAGIISGAEERFREDIVSRLTEMQSRVDTLEEKLRKEAWARLKAEAMLMRLLNSHNKMRADNGLEKLTYEDIESKTVDPREPRTSAQWP